MYLRGKWNRNRNRNELLLFQFAQELFLERSRKDFVGIARVDCTNAQDEDGGGQAEQLHRIHCHDTFESVICKEVGAQCEVNERSAGQKGSQCKAWRSSGNWSGQSIDWSNLFTLASRWRPAQRWAELSLFPEEILDRTFGSKWKCDDPTEKGGSVYHHANSSSSKMQLVQFVALHKPNSLPLEHAGMWNGRSLTFAFCLYANVVLGCGSKGLKKWISRVSQLISTVSSSNCNRSPHLMTFARTQGRSHDYISQMTIKIKG